MNFSRARSMSARPEVNKSLLSDIRLWVSGTGMVFSFIFSTYFLSVSCCPVLECCDTETDHSRQRPPRRGLSTEQPAYTGVM